MAKLIITGSINQLKLIVRENRIRASRSGISFSLVEDDISVTEKTCISNFPNQESDHEFSVRKIIPMIEACASIYELKKFDGDDRKTVIAAYLKKLKSFEA